ncbi:30S ribosomal protein S18 [Candidatus Saccharibacteria bacterium]|nr:30S ribosomal protein S18 [Candidatus Saccharibacteria bacterium]
MAKDTATKQQKPELDNSYFDHKDIDNLKRFVNQFGQIENRHRSSANRDKPVLRACEQKRLSKAVKRARFLALLPFINRDTDS